MQKKSEAKQRKMQSMVALSAGAMSGMAGRAAGIGISKTQSTLLSQDKPKAQATIAGTTTNTTTTTTTESDNQAAASSNEPQQPTTTTKSPGKSLVKQLEPLLPAAGQDQEKSERSSSPAFDSDEESTTGPATQTQPLSQLRKRSSLAGLVAQSGALQVFAPNARINGILPVKVEMNLPMAAAALATGKRISPTSPLREPPRLQALPKIQESSLLDTENPADERGPELERSSPGEFVLCCGYARYTYTSQILFFSWQFFTIDVHND